MAQSGYTPIQLYRSTTGGAAPAAGNLAPGELAINIANTDMALFAENASGNVVKIMNNPAGLTYPTADGTNGQFVKTDGSGVLAFSNTLIDPAITGTILEDVYTIVDGAAFEIDPGNGSIQLITLGASRTPKATNFAAGEAITLMVDDGSDYTITWTDATFGGSGVVWFTDSGVAPTLATTGYTTIVLWKVSTQVYGARVGDV
jgi:archaellum component FlaG (FlaF/FlaG flagellin family)